MLALAAQIAVDLVATTLREGLGAGIRPPSCCRCSALVYLIDALLAPIGFLAVLATDVHEYAYLLAIAPGALLGLITRERSTRIAHELALERAFRRSTRALDARADDLRRQAGRLQRPDRRVGEAAGTPEDRDALERILLATTVEALQADGGRLSELDDDGTLQPRLAIGADDARAGRPPSGRSARCRTTRSRSASATATCSPSRAPRARSTPSSATCSSTSPRRPRSRSRTSGSRS